MTDAGISITSATGFTTESLKSSSVSNLTRTAGPIALIGLQLGLLLLLLRTFEIEPDSGLTRILPLIFVGFFAHSALPMAWRPAGFLLLSVGAILLVTGLAPGVAIVLLGLLLVGTCHLPIRYSIRVLLLVLIAGILAVSRGPLMHLPAAMTSGLGLADSSRVVLPVLASMFMFRLIIYMYDLRHEERARVKVGATGKAVSPTSWATRLSYFFLLPNVCFLLFPIIDYRSYRRTYYSRNAVAIYQKGVWWMFLGFVYLLLYRLVYHYLVPAPDEVQGIGGIVRFMTSSYLVYLRVVGQFHLITGILCLFGLDLPPAHRFYLLATSFTDFWRRARIEWKDFMVKIFYYPSLVPLQRRWGATPALVLATIVVFFSTWVLHSYQWFWLRGDWRQGRADAVFWVAIGGCVLINSLLESGAGRQKRKPGGTEAIARYLFAGTKAVGMFVFMCVLWSYWSSPSFNAWLAYLSAAENSDTLAYALLSAGLVAAVIIFSVAIFIVDRYEKPSVHQIRKATTGPLMSFLAWRPVAVVAGAIVLLLAHSSITRGAPDSGLRGVFAMVSGNTLNSMDQEREDRGYYEVLLDEPRSTAAYMSSVKKSRPEAATAVDPEEDLGVPDPAPAEPDAANGGKNSGNVVPSVKPSIGIDSSHTGRVIAPCTRPGC